jgi:hypothetical protein
MMMRNLQSILILAMFFTFAGLGAAHAENLFRFYPEAQLNGFYGDNIPIKTNNGEGDFGTAGVLGFYLDYTSAARYMSLHYDTFAQLFLQHHSLDRAGSGQFVYASDDENLSPTTKLHLDDFFYRDAPAVLTVTTSDQAPQFNSALALILLANDQASINQFKTTLWHDWGRQWTSEFWLHQTTYFATGNNNGNNRTSYYQGANGSLDYHLTSRFSLGAGFQFFDFRSTAPGLPGQQTYWPYLRTTWAPMENVFFEGMVGVVVSHTQGMSGDSVNPAGTGQISYNFSQRGHVAIFGGREPEVTSAFGSVGEVSSVRGNLLYDFTQRLTGTAGGGFYELDGNGFNGKFISWGVGLSDRVNKWLSVNTRFIQVRSNETGSNQFLTSGTKSGQWAVGNYYVVGLAVSIEAFRWSWQ